MSLPKKSQKKAKKAGGRVKKPGGRVKNPEGGSQPSRREGQNPGGRVKTRREGQNPGGRVYPPSGFLTLPPGGLGPSRGRVKSPEGVYFDPSLGEQTKEVCKMKKKNHLSSLRGGEKTVETGGAKNN